MAETLVVITANVDKGDRARLDLEVVDGSNHRNVYQARKGLQGEMRLAITTHNDADLGVCFKNTLDASELLNLHYGCFCPLTALTDVAETESHKYGRAVDLDVDIGADAVDYNAIAKAGTCSHLALSLALLTMYAQSHCPALKLR